MLLVSIYHGDDLISQFVSSASIEEIYHFFKEKKLLKFPKEGFTSPYMKFVVEIGEDKQYLVVTFPISIHSDPAYILSEMEVD